ncbi:hypothetical protein Adt_35073 [Abeliophyllum distichum]|uniref:Uncharacterized protein n=1 Tax=Abeliophyllum distichum TaxID=126358 RepID=A0ABD1QEZ7_9LAMI
MGLGYTAAWLLPYLQGASAYCLALQPRTRPYCSLAPPIPPRSIASLLRPPTWDSAKLQLGSFLTSNEHRLAAWPSLLGLDLTATWPLPYFQGASPRCLALPPGTRKNYSVTLPLSPRASPYYLALQPRTWTYCSLAPPILPRSIASLLRPPTWDSAKLQLGSFLTSNEHHLAAWPSLLGLGLTATWPLPYFQGASPHCFALLPGTRPNCCLAPSLLPRRIALRLGPPTRYSAKLLFGSFLTFKEHRFTASPFHLGLEQATAWLLPYVQNALPRCLALPPGTRLNCSWAPPLPKRSIASLLGPPTWDSTKLQLGSSHTSKEHRLAAWHYHLGLSLTVTWPLPYLPGASPHCLALPPAWLLPYLQKSSLRCLALPPGTRLNCGLALPLPPWNIASLLGPLTWDSAKLRLGYSLTSKEHRLAAWPYHLGLGKTTAWLFPYLQVASPCYLPSHMGLGYTAAWLLPYLQGASAYCLALQPRTGPYCSLAPPIPPRSIASLLRPPTWDSAKLQLGSFLTSNEHRLAAWPSLLGLGLTATWPLPYFQGASPRSLALPPGTRKNYSVTLPLFPSSIALLLALPHGTRPYCSLAPPLPPRSIALLLSTPA